VIALEKLTTGPVLSLVATVAAAAAATTGVVNSLGLAPFWTDVVHGSVFLALAIYWGLHAAIRSRPDRPVGFTATAPASRSTRDSLARALPAIGVAAVLLLCSGWFLLAPASQLAQPHWKLCGSITGGCSPDFCVLGLDAKSRPIDKECIPPLDASGYIELDARGGTRYKPVWITVQCRGKDSITRHTPNSFFAQDCSARMSLQ
jgi:hypothetical protein